MVCVLSHLVPLRKARFNQLLEGFEALHRARCDVGFRVYVTLRDREPREKGRVGASRFDIKTSVSPHRVKAVTPSLWETTCVHAAACVPTVCFGVSQIANSGCAPFVPTNAAIGADGVEWSSRAPIFAMRLRAVGYCQTAHAYKRLPL